MLITTQTVWASPMPAISIAPSRETPSFFQIEIPEDLAAVDEVYEAPASQDPKVILHIQNVHGNYQAQVQVKKMLDYFYKNYGFKTVFVEGAAEKLDPKYLELFPDKKDNMALADELTKKGQLTGPELYLMDAPEDVRAVGIEQADLYRGNYTAFKEVYGAKKGVDSFLKQLDSRLELLSSRFLTRDMRRILSEWQKFHEGRREFMPFVKHLAEESQKFLNLDLNSLFAQVEWPQTARLLVLQSMEADLKQDEAMAERDKLIQFLEEHKASEVLVNGLKNMEEKTISLQRLASGKGEDPFQPRKLLERLAEEAAPMGFQFHQYPNFSLYAGYTILESELDSKVLFQEIEKLFDRILESLTISEKEKNLLELYKDLELLKKLMALELTRTEWDQATYRKDWIKPQSLVERLDKMSASGFVTEDISVTKKIPGVFDAAFRFYDFARQREFAFYDTIEKEMKTQKADRAILVTGGFHTDGLSDIFRSKQINYGILTPRMGGDFDKTNYIHTLMETHPTLFDLAQMEMVNTLMSSMVRAQMGQNVHKQVIQIVEAYLNQLDIASDRSIAPRQVKSIAELIEQANIAFEKLSGPGAGFRETAAKGEDGQFRYQLRIFDPITGLLETVKNEKGVPRIFIIDPGFREPGRRSVAIGPESPDNANADSYKSVRMSPAVTLDDQPENKSEFILENVRVVSGVNAQRRLATVNSDLDVPELDEDNFSGSPYSEREMSVQPAPLESRLVLADKWANAGRWSDVINALTSTVNAKSLGQFLEAMNGSKETSKSLEDFVDQTDIPEEHKPLLKLFLAKSTEPGALLIKLNEVQKDLKLKDFAAQIEAYMLQLKVLLEEHKGQFITLVLPDGLTDEQKAVFDEKAKLISGDLALRFKVMEPGRLTAAEVFRFMITLMQRMGFIKPGSISSLVERFGTLYDESAESDTQWVDFFARHLNQGDIHSTDKMFAGVAGAEAYRQVLVLGAFIGATLSRLQAAEIDQSLMELLVANGDHQYHLNEKAALDLAISLLAVWAEYNKALSASA